MHIDAFALSMNDEASVLDQWDFGMVKDLLEGELWKPHNFPEFKIQSVSELPERNKAVVILPARHHAGLEKEVNSELKKIDTVALFLIGDEEADYDITKLKVPKGNIWIQNPHPDKHADYNKIGTGYPQHMREMLPDEYPEKNTDVFFSGQITHERRQIMWDNLKEYETQGGNLDIKATNGFTQGFEPKEYYRRLARAKITPAPCGAVIPDSFRLYEALETMTIPLADNRNSQRTVNDYWQFMFDSDPPFPLIDEWDELVGLSQRILTEQYPRIMHEQTAWYMKWKRNLAYKLTEVLDE